MFLPCLYCNGAADSSLDCHPERSEGSDKRKWITDNFRINDNEDKKDFLVCGCPVNGSGGVVCLQQGRV